MIEEAYVSFEVAKMLKEKGFNEPITELNKLLFKEGEKPVLEITHQKAMRWLREVHNLCVAPYAAAYRYGFTIDKADTGSNLGNEMNFYPDEEFETYEDAVEAALKYCLKNLI